MAYQPLPPVGQDDMAGSLPVVIASDQSAVPVSGTFFQATQPVSGTVTANIGTVATLATAAKQDTGNTSLATLAGAVTSAKVQVDVISMPAGGSGLTDAELRATPVPVSVSGVATAAKQDTIIGHLDGVEGVLGTIDADTGNISTKIDTLAGAVAGAEMQVDVLTMPTTTVQATNLDIRDLVNTDVVTAELSATDNAVLDAIAASVAAIDTDTSTLIGHVDGLEALIGTTNTTLTTIDGRVDGIEALLTTIDADTSNLSVVGGGTEAAAIRVTIANNSTGVLSVDDNGGNISIDDGGNSITVDAPVGTPAFVRLSDGSSAISTLPVSLASVPSHAVTNAGTFPVQVDGSALTALQLIDDPVFADDAGYTLGTSKATIVGGVAVETDGTDPLSVSAEGDAAAFRTDRNRRLLVNKNHPNLWKVNENHSSAQTNNQLKAAPGAGLSFYITDIIISNGATAGTVKLVEDEGGTPVDIAGPFYFAINGGMSSHLETPIRMTANKSLGFTSVTSTTHTVTVMGYTAP